MNLDTVPCYPRTVGVPSAPHSMHGWVSSEMYEGEMTGYLDAHAYTPDDTSYGTGCNMGSYFRGDMISLAAQLCDITAADDEASLEEQIDVAQQDNENLSQPEVTVLPKTKIEVNVLTPLECYKAGITHDWYHPSQHSIISASPYPDIDGYTSTAPLGYTTEVYKQDPACRNQDSLHIEDGPSPLLYTEQAQASPEGAALQQVSTRLTLYIYIYRLGNIMIPIPSVDTIEAMEIGRKGFILSVIKYKNKTASS